MCQPLLLMTARWRHQGRHACADPPCVAALFRSNSAPRLADQPDISAAVLFDTGSYDLMLPAECIDGCELPSSLAPCSPEPDSPFLPRSTGPNGFFDTSASSSFVNLNTTAQIACTSNSCSCPSDAASSTDLALGLCPQSPVVALLQAMLPKTASRSAHTCSTTSTSVRCPSESDLCTVSR